MADSGFGWTFDPGSPAPATDEFNPSMPSGWRSDPSQGNFAPGIFQGGTQDAPPNFAPFSPQMQASEQARLYGENHNGGLDPMFWAALAGITGGAGLAGLGAGAAGGLVGGAEGALGAAGGASLAGGELAGGLDLVGGAAGGLGGAAGGVSGFSGPGAEVVNSSLDLTVPGGAGLPGMPGAPGGQPSGGTQFIDATTPTVSLSPDTMSSLGISPSSFSGGGTPSFAFPETGATGAGFVPGGGDASLIGGGEGGMGGAGGASLDAADPNYLDKAAELWKKLGISPGTALQLGMAGKNALTTPKLPAAAKTLQDQAGPGAQQAMSVIQSGGQGSPAWAAQKQSIDAGIDQQVQEQTQAIMQNAVNSGMGADSQVVVQQVNKLKTQLETQRQALYSQAQQQNVQSALQSLGIQDTALASVANAQFRQSDEAKASAAQTAQNALMLQALSRGQQQPASAEPPP